MPRCGHATHVGLRRSSQEDSCGSSDLHGCYVVADGMGGHEGGEVASAAAVSSALASAIAAPPGDRAEDVARRAVVAAHSAVLERALGRLRGMGTTAVVAVLRGRLASIAHVGDSRAYSFGRTSGLAQLTRDHAHPLASHVLLRAAGSVGGGEPDVATHEVPPGGALILCTDGLHGPVPGRVIERVMGATLWTEGPEAAARALVRESLSAGGPDNVTVMVVTP